MKKLVVIPVLATTALLALAAAGCGGGSAPGGGAGSAPGDGGSSDTAVAKSSGGAVVIGAPAEVDAVTPSSAQEPASPGRSVASLPELGARVVQTASLRILVPKGRFDETANRVRTIASALGGYVSGSSASQGGDGRLVSGTLAIRVPESRYADAMTQLARLGKIERRDESGQDVGAQYVDLQARANHLEAVQTRLLELLDKAQTVADALAIQSQIDPVQLELEQVRGQLRYLDDQTTYATIALDLHEKPVPVAGGGKDDGRGVVDAWRDGVHAFVRVASDVFVAIATVAPILLLAAGLLLVGRYALVRANRRRAA
jgi:hypothetical protein